jgi:acyl dehydratase
MSTALRSTLDRVDASRMKTLALLLGDPNPIHFDAAAAERLGTGGRRVNQGPSTIAMIYNLFAEQLPGQRVRRLDVRLLGNVLEDDRVEVEASPREDGAYDVTVSSGSGDQLTVKVSGVAHLEAR